MSYNPSYEPGFLPQETPRGSSCSNPSPTSYNDYTVFCKGIEVKGQTNTEKIVVNGTEYDRILFLNPLDGSYYYVLATKYTGPPPTTTSF